MAINEKKEKLFGELAVSRGLVTEGQLHKVNKIRAAHAKKGNLLRVGEVMMQLGMITREQALVVLKEATLAMGEKPRIGGYEIETLLGRGAMGTVYKARQLSMDRPVALKLLSRDLSDNEEFVERFMREAKTTAQLNHKNIVSGIDIGESNGYHYFAMEFVQGKALEEILKKKGVLPSKEAAEITLSVVAGLEHASRQGVIHRDIKPANIMITDDGVPKIADMGLAIASGMKTSEHMTGTGIAVGTPYYMAPEQVEGKPHIDFRADIYSLGATLFEAVTGHKPFEGANVPAIMAMRLYEDPPIAYKRFAASGKPISAIICKMMAKDPADRYQDFPSLEKDLTAVAKGRLPSCMGILKKGKTSHKSTPGDKHANEMPQRRTTKSKKPQNKKLLIYVCSGLGALAAILVVAIIVKLALKDNSPKHPYPDKMNAEIWKPLNISLTDGEKARRKWEEACKVHQDVDILGRITPKKRQQLVDMYKSIIDSHPNSAYAKVARQRIINIEKIPEE